MGQEISCKRWSIGKSLVEAKEKQLYGRRKDAKKFNEFVVTATVGLGLERCPEQPSLFWRPGTTLIFDLHQEDFYVSWSSVELA